MLPSVLDDLPIILVSAANESAAAKIISDIIDNEVTEVQCNENMSLQRVWRIVNKYYMADVCLRPFIDDEPTLPELDNIEAHIVYLTEDECAGSDENIVEVCEARVQRVGTAGQQADVRLVVAECSMLPDPLVMATTRLHLELVSLHLDPTQQDSYDDDKEDHGLNRVRAALHAHKWKGLKLAASAVVPLSLLAYTEGSDTSSGGEEGEESGESEGEGSGGEAEAVERAEAFAEALAALRGAREARDARGARQYAGEGGEERTRRADALLAAFRLALGDRLDAR